jgi:hypothetical protein
LKYWIAQQELVCFGAMDEEPMIFQLEQELRFQSHKSLFDLQDFVKARSPTVL